MFISNSVVLIVMSQAQYHNHDAYTYSRGAHGVQCLSIVFSKQWSQCSLHTQNLNR